MTALADLLPDGVYWQDPLTPGLLRELLAAERERICNALPGGYSVDPQWVADMVRGGA